MTASGSINLIPLVDILCSIVFFSLLTYSGATMAALTAYDLSLPPVVVTGEQANAAAKDKDLLTLLLAVRIEDGRLLVEHSEQGGFRREIKGMDDNALAQLQTTMSEIKQQYPQNSDVLVVPGDNVSYDNVIKVLERLRLAEFSGISLGSRARVAQIAAAGR